jgi:hypothetical protein
VGVVRGPLDPARDGFGFRNPAGMAPKRTGGGTLLRRLDAFLYGSGLCFGMAAAALANFRRPTSPYPLAALPLTPELLGTLRGYHARQARPRVVVAAAWDWVRGRGGRPEGLAGSAAPAGRKRRPAPAQLRAGPERELLPLPLPGARHRTVLGRRGWRGAAYLRLRSQSSGDRGRYVSFRGGGFGYGGFLSGGGWGITLVPLSAIRDTARPSVGEVT